MKSILFKISILIIALSAASTINAEELRTPFRLPAAHAGHSALDAANALAKSACAAVRENSPFAEMDAASEEINSDSNGELVGQLSAFAKKFLGRGYRRGAAGPKLFDCSGFIGYIFKNFGFNLSRSSSSQYAEGERVSRDEIKPGDLLFFSSHSSGKGRVGHVAMVVDVKADGSCTFIHASPNKGISYQSFPDGGYYSRNFIGAKRIIGAKESPKA